MTITTSMFKPINRSIVGMGADRIEYEKLIAWMLNHLIEHELDIQTPIQLKYPHNNMTEAGWLVSHGDGFYSLSLKAITTLYEWCKQNDLINTQTVE